MTTPSARFAAAVYPARRGVVGFLAAFAHRLKGQGVRVAGIVQEQVRDSDGVFIGIDAIDVATGTRTPIKRTDGRPKDSTQCALDVAALAETSRILRDAIAEHAELIVLDKFGVEEQKGRGLSDEIMAVITENIPLLISVPEPAIDIWTERTGGLGDVVRPDGAALERWWISMVTGSPPLTSRAIS